MSQPQLKLVDGIPVDHETGELVEGTGHVPFSEIEDLENRIRLLEKDLHKKRKEIDTLKRNRDRERRTHAQRLVIEDIYEEWVTVTGRGPGTRLGPSRFDAVAARLNEDRERWHFSLAIHGAANKPTVGDDGTVYQDLELICRTESKFEAFCRRCPPEIAATLRPRFNDDGRPEERPLDHSQSTRGAHNDSNPS